MFTKITDKFQITIPKEIRTRLKLKKNDSIEWKYDSGRIIIKPAKRNTIDLKGSIKTGSGNIDMDIENMKKIRAKMTDEKYHP